MAGLSRRFGRILGHRWLVALGIVVLTNAALWACNVPVFRFALERWRPDAYRVAVFHRGPLSATDRGLITSLEEQQSKSTANIAFRSVDLNALENTEEEKAVLQLLTSPEQAATEPWLTVHYPVHLGIDKPIYAGPLSAEKVSTVLDSPVRQELVRRLGEGQTAVWLLLECGRPADDDAAAKVVEDELKKLKEDLKLPELTDSPDDSILAGVPLRLDFSLLRVQRKDAKEQALVNMLVQSESDLLERDDPMVFPVFGRGRALFTLVGQGITADNVRDSAAFLTGACSCEVKEQNPGFDLLLKTDWESLFIRNEATAAVLASREAKESTTPQLVAIPPGASASESTPSDASSVAESQSSPAMNCFPSYAEEQRKQRLTFAGLATISVLATLAIIVRRRMHNRA